MAVYGVMSLLFTPAKQADIANIKSHFVQIIQLVLLIQQASGLENN
jgi:hypothetical protein